MNNKKLNAEYTEVRLFNTFSSQIGHWSYIHGDARIFCGLKLGLLESIIFW